MPKEMVASIVAQDSQRMTHWGGICASIQCTIASRNKIRLIVEDREKVRGETEQGAAAAPQVSPEPQTEDLMNRILVGIMTKVDEKLKCTSNNSLSLPQRLQLQQKFKILFWAEEAT